MLDNQSTSDVAVDRRQETVVTQQPGYVATEQVTRDGSRAVAVAPVGD